MYVSTEAEQDHKLKAGISLSPNTPDINSFPPCTYLPGYSQEVENILLPPCTSAGLTNGIWQI